MIYLVQKCGEGTVVREYCATRAYLAGNYETPDISCREERRFVYNADLEETPYYYGRYRLRHTFATRCIEDGVKPNVLQKILGHASSTITMGLYVHETQEEKHCEIRKLGGIEEDCVKVV